MATEITGRPDDSELAPHARAYAALVPDGSITELLSAQMQTTLTLLQSVSDEYAASFTYAPGKWTIKQVVSHLADAERILSCRALRLARKDPTPLPGFDQDLYILNSNANARSLAALIDELRMIRDSTLALYRSFSGDEFMRRGLVNNCNLSVRAIAYTTAGHELHHLKILREQYLPERA